MTDETARHFDSVRRVARHQAEQEWLRQAYENLARQRACLEALTSALAVHNDLNESEIARLSLLRRHAARVVIAQCDAIMRHSGLTGLDHSDWGDQPASESGEAREESLPW